MHFRNKSCYIPLWWLVVGLALLQELANYGCCLSVHPHVFLCNAFCKQQAGIEKGITIKKGKHESFFAVDEQFHVCEWLHIFIIRTNFHFRIFSSCTPTRPGSACDRRRRNKEGRLKERDRARSREIFKTPFLAAGRITDSQKALPDGIWREPRQHDESRIHQLTWLERP